MIYKSILENLGIFYKDEKKNQNTKINKNLTIFLLYFTITTKNQKWNTCRA